MINIINTYRERHNKPRVYNWDGVVSDYCHMHNFAMSKNKDIYHAELCYLEGWSEIVARTYFDIDEHTTACILVYDIIDSSEAHRNILLNSSTMAYNLLFSNGSAYLTIRGR